MQITISERNMFIRSYKFWGNYYYPPNDVCEFINRYIPLVIFKMIPLLFIASIFIVSTVYTIATWYVTDLDTVLSIDVTIFSVLGITVILFVCLAVFAGLLAVCIEAVHLIKLPKVNVKTPDSIKLIKSVVSSKIDKLCIKLNYKD